MDNQECNKEISSRVESLEESVSILESNLENTINDVEALKKDRDKLSRDAATIRREKARKHKEEKKNRKKQEKEELKDRKEKSRQKKAQKKSDQKKNKAIIRHYKRKNNVAIFLVVLGTAIGVILLLNIISNYFVVRKAFDSPVVDISGLFQGTLLSTGLSVVSIAISVWVGLHIIQVVEKGQLEELSQKYSSYEKEQLRKNKEEFFSALSDEERSDTKYFYELFSESIDIKDDIPANIFYVLTNIETTYNKLYQKQYKFKKTLDDRSIRLLIDYVLEIRAYLQENILSSSSRDALAQYIDCREANYYFNMGYDDSEGDMSHDYFQRTIDIYTKQYGISVIKDKKRVELGTLSTIKDRFIDKNIGLEYVINVLNILAESYSKSAYKDLYPRVIFEKKDKSIEYLNCAIIIYDVLENTNNFSTHLSEVIYRNHGAAIERLIKAKKCNETNDKYIQMALSDDETDDINQVKEKYKKAINTALKQNDGMPIRRKVFLAYGALYYRVVEYYCSRINDSVCDRKELEEGPFCKNSIDFKQWTNDAYSYMNIALRYYPSELGFNKTHSLASLWKTFFESICEENNEIARECFALAKQSYDVSRLFIGDDNEEANKSYIEDYKKIQEFLREVIGPDR